MNEGLVSIIIPCYNGEDFLEQTLKSVQWQRYSNWECIFVDDGSTDRSPQIFKSFAEKDSRFKYFRQENKGPVVARNLGIDLAKGEFIQFLDDDDLIPPNRLDLCVEHFQKYPVIDVVYTDYVTYRKGEGFTHSLPAKIPHSDILRAFLFELNVTFVVLIHSLMFKREVIALNKFDISLKYHAEDVECWIRIAASGVRFSYLDEVLAVYRYTSDSLGSNESKLIKAKLEVLQRWENHTVVKKYITDFVRAKNNLKERLAIGYFMEREFKKGWISTIHQWNNSSWSSRIKMLGWFFTMVFLSKSSFIKFRTWIFKHTPFRWGGWKELTIWNPPESLQKLISE